MNIDIVSEKKIYHTYGVAGCYISMAIFILLLYAFNNFTGHQLQPIDPSLSPYYSGWVVKIANTTASWHIPFSTSDFISCLWAINLFLSFGIIGNLSLLLYRPRWFHHLVGAVLCSLGIFAVFVIYHIFPFDFRTGTTITLAKTVLIVIMAGTCIGLIIEIVRFFIAFLKREPPPPLLPVSPLSSISPEPPVYIASPLPSELPSAPPSSVIPGPSPTQPPSAPPEPPQPPVSPAQ